MRKAKNIYFLLIYKKTKWPKAGYLPQYEVNMARTFIAFTR